MNLKGKTALVTGGAVRIGRAICERLADAGCHVVIHYLRSTEAADRLAEDLRHRGVKALTVQSDLATEQGGFDLMETAWARTGGIDFLVNNAAVFHKASLHDTTGEALLATLQVNLVSPFLLVREFAARAKRGAVVNLLDRRIAGTEAGCAAYLLSKKALAEFTRIAALELAPRITVNGVAPGPILVPVGVGAKESHDRAGPIPMQARPSVQAVADAVLYLLQAEGITGQVLFVDGGQHLLGGGT